MNYINVAEEIQEVTQLVKPKMIYTEHGEKRRKEDNLNPKRRHSPFLSLDATHDV